MRDPEEEAPLLPIDAYLGRILGVVEPLPPRDASLAAAHGCVTAAEVVAPLDLPPFESSAMDGYAVRSDDVATATEQEPVRLRVAGEVRIGAPAGTSVGAGTAVIVPTGGIVPDGADAVIPVELTDRDGDDVLILRAVPKRKHVRPAGEDARAGDVVVAKGRRLAAPDIGVLAACGCATVLVHPTVRVGVLSTGDELVRPPDELRYGQIYDSNSFTLVAALQEAGAVAVQPAPVTDAPGALVAALEEIDDRVDAFVCSGGVSMGERDPVKRAFEDSDEIAFANVAMQPGRPQAFGRWRGKPFFGLPGNPISVFISFEVFVRPALMRMMGRTDTRSQIDVMLEGSLDAPKTRSRVARVRVSMEGGRLKARPEGGHQSNLLATFAKADGLVLVPAGTTIEDGETCRVTLLREI